MAKLYTTKELEKLLKAGPAWLELGRLNKTEHAPLIDIIEKSADAKQVYCQFKSTDPEEGSLFDDVEDSPGFVTGDEANAAQIDEDEEFASNAEYPITARVPTVKEFTKKVIDFAQRVPVGKNGVLQGETFEKKRLQVVQGVLARLAKKLAEGSRWVAGKCPDDETKIRIWRL